MTDPCEITLEAVSSVGQITADEWDACAQSDGAYNPFVSHAFFSALEVSGSAVARTGWAARHLVARMNGQAVGIVPRTSPTGAQQSVWTTMPSKLLVLVWAAWCSLLNG